MCVRSCVRLGYDRTVPAGAMALAASDVGAQLQQPAGDSPTGPRARMLAIGTAGWRCVSVDACETSCAVTVSVAVSMLHAARSIVSVVRCMPRVACCVFRGVLLHVACHVVCCCVAGDVCAQCRALRVVRCVLRVVCWMLRVMMSVASCAANVATCCVLSVGCCASCFTLHSARCPCCARCVLRVICCFTHHKIHPAQVCVASRLMQRTGTALVPARPLPHRHSRSLCTCRSVVHARRQDNAAGAPWP
jgi:hypothetical protein